MRDYFLRYTGPKIDELLDAVANATEYQLCVDNVGGNVVRVGTIEMEGDSFGIYEFYYKTSALPDTKAKEYYLGEILQDYSVRWFIEVTGVTSDGIVVSSGRTDNTNSVIVQQLSRNNKTFTIRAYQDFTGNTALFRITFIGKKTS